MSLKEIIERFTLVSGLEMKEVSRYMPIIEDCRLYFESRAGEGLSEADTRRLEYSCAVYAFYKVSRAGRLDGLRSFKVGDVQMEIEDYGAYAEKLWAEERDNISDLIDVNGGFAFRGVRV